MTQYTHKQRVEIAEAAWREGRIIQNAWTERNRGRDLVCALAAFVPEITENKDSGWAYDDFVNQCPADFMPPWLAALIPSIDDGLAAKDVHCFMAHLLARARVWDRFNSEQWQAIQAGLVKWVDPDDDWAKSRAKALFALIDAQLGFTPDLPELGDAIAPNPGVMGAHVL